MPEYRVVFLLLLVTVSADTFSRLTNWLSLIGQLLLLINLPLLLLGQVTVNWFAILILILAPTLSALAQLG